MSLHIYTNGESKILHGSDTDVSVTTITKLHSNCFIVSTVWHMDVEVITREEFDGVYNLQKGTPIQYISEENYLEFLK